MIDYVNLPKREKSKIIKIIDNSVLNFDNLYKEECVIISLWKFGKLLLDGKISMKLVI